MATIYELPAFSDADRAPSQRVVIIGAGYAGLRCAQALSKYVGDPGVPEVILIDRYSYHQLITELPGAAGGRLAPSEVAVPFAEALKDLAVRFEQAEVEGINLPRKLVVTTRGDVAYGTLVVAVGSVTAFYGVPGLVDYALTLKSVEDADSISARVRAAVADAAAETDAATRAMLLSFLIGGAGLTGVELAGKLSEFLKVLVREYDIPATEPRVTLVEAAPSVLPSMPAKLQSKGAQILTDLGVHLVLGSKVVAADAGGVTLASGDRLLGSTLVWSGGIMAPPLLARSGLPTARNGQVPVNPYLRVPDYPDVFVIGDASLLLDPSGRGILEPTAQVALKQAEAAAYNIVANWEGWQPRPYVPTDKGQAVSLGTERGVASIFHVSLAGRKVIALKRLIEEGYRYSVTGRFGRPKRSVPARSVS